MVGKNSVMCQRCCQIQTGFTVQVLISSIFYGHLFRTKVFYVVKLFFCQKEIGAKDAHKIWMKLATGVNFIKNLWAAYCAKVFWVDFMCLKQGFVISWQKNIGKKAVRKIMVKSTSAQLVWQSKPFSRTTLTSQSTRVNFEIKTKPRLPCPNLWNVLSICCNKSII